MPATLTPRQKEVLEFVKSYYTEKGYSPSLQEIRKKLGVASVSTAHYYVSRLQSAGHIRREDRHPRSISVPESDQMVQIPLLGIIAAGQPIEAIEDKETIAVPQHQLPLYDKVFALKVVGESMIDENINDGDLLLVRQQETAENGQKVVALIDNQAATLKKFYKGRGGVLLQPANKDVEPIILKRDRELKIQGIVLDVIKNNEAPPTFPVHQKKASKQTKKLSLNKIVLGDTLQELPKLPPNSCDVIIADPPYNIGKNFGNNRDKRDLQEYISWSKAWIDECLRVLKPTGTLFIYGFSEILAHISTQLPLEKQRWLIWHYTNKNVASYNFWQRSHESILCTWKAKPTFNRDAVREPYTEGFLNGAAGKIRKDTAGRFSRGGRKTVYKAHEGGALPRDVLKIPALAGGAGMTERWFLCKTCDDVFEPQSLKEHRTHEIIKHPTQKPLELTRRLIRSCAPENAQGVVLIPFAGSGSECVAAKQLGLDYVGHELYADYVKLARAWVKRA